ncbi:hypothetical protein KR026_008117 [Drosophila bipectinata]|nr:hypothetical protein KR026_008117 [Drosophila bipectinata]
MKYNRKMYRNCIKNLANWTLKGVVYGSWVLGVFPFTFNLEKTQIIYLKSLQIYGLLLNFGLLALVLYTYEDENSGMEIFDRNEIIQKVEFSLDFLGVVTFVVIHLLTLWKSRRLLKILNELWSIQKRHFVESHREHCSFDRYIVCKGFGVVLKILSIISLNFGFPQEGSKIWSNLNVCYYVIILTGALLTMAHFHIILVYIHQFIRSINHQLLEFVLQLEKGQKPESEDIRVLLRIYSRLLNIKDKLSSIYEVELTLEIATLFFYNIGVAYSLIIFSINAERYNFLGSCVIIPQYLTVNLWELWLGIMICDLFEYECRKTSMVLRRFTDFTDMDKDMKKSVQEFASFCCHRPNTIRLCGLFDVNYKMGYRLVNTNFLYILFLAQFDYMNIKLK